MTKQKRREIPARRRSPEKAPTPEARLQVLEGKVVDLTTTVDELTKQITQYHVTGQGNLEKLTRDRRNADEELKDVRLALPLLRERIEKDTRELARARASARMTGIARAHGSLVSQLDDDEARCRKAGAEYEASVQRLNDRFKSIIQLQAEVNALQDRFAIAAPQFSPVVVPNRRELTSPEVELLDHGHRAPSTEEHAESGTRRRDYLEISGTPAFEIIGLVGLKPFPPISAAVQAARERSARQEREFTDRMAVEVDPTRAPPLPEHVR